MGSKKKNLHHRQKNKAKVKKNATAVRRLAAEQQVIKVKTVSFKRGRPPLPRHIKWRRSLAKQLKLLEKKKRYLVEKLTDQYIFLLKRLRIKKGRGRKRLPLLQRASRRFASWQQRLARQRLAAAQLLHELRAAFKPKRKVGRPRKRKLVINYAASITVTVLLLAAAYTTYDVVIRDLPAATDLSTKQQNLTTRILDRNGNLLYRIYEDENRTLVPLHQVSQYLKDATIAIEDQNFYRHIGFSPGGIMRAFIKNISGERIQGGSTITQQLVKNRLLSNEKTYRRKVRELLLSVIVERLYSKEQILEMYLNTVAYGGSTYGIEEAAWRYFAKSAKELSLAEAALLAGLPQAPSVYTPFGANPETAYARQAEVLRRMVADGYISQLQADEARAEKLVFNQDRIDIEAPHFVMYVRRLLAERYGEALVATGGLEVRTTLDLEIHNSAQAIVTQEITQLGYYRISNGAALVTNPKTGEILAMVGGANYFDFEHDGQVNVTIRPRQPGSSIKPLVYAVAFEAGKTAASMIDDAPIVYQIPGSRPYAPRNYDGKFRGPVTIREALGSSYNIPAVKTIAEVGVNTVIDKAEALGIDTWQDRSRFGLSLALGAGEVLMTDLAEAYSSFANLGYSVDLNPLLEVRTAQGTTLYRNGCALDKSNCYDELSLSPRAAYLITDILADNKARTPVFGPLSVLQIPGQQVAVKTGTTNSLKDNWTVGYTTDRLVATWVGNNDNTPMSYVASGITGASPIWNKIMRLLLDEEQPHRFVEPANMVRVKICAATGTLPCLACPRIVEEIFVEGTQPQAACSNESFTPKTEVSPPLVRGQIL